AVFPDGGTFGTIGGGGLEKKVIEDAIIAMKNGSSFTRTYNLAGKDKGGFGPICGGEASVHVEIIRSPDTILLCGGGHIAKALAPMVGALGFNLIVVDEREQYASKDRFPQAGKILVARPSDPKIRDLVTPSTYIIILTHSHKSDREALKNIVSTEAAYIGMIGSSKKVNAIMKALKSDGVPAETLGRVHSPVGLDIGAETPEEIAISILSEIIHVKRKGPLSPISMRMAPRR
ncbi:MAG: XdhC family protein, partial [Candidatus Krumholzibacteria bacterium]|nr:XdhC family protein [Candidatus Krumholzibacteria bacterium]